MIRSRLRTLVLVLSIAVMSGACASSAEDVPAATSTGAASSSTSTPDPTVATSSAGVDDPSGTLSGFPTTTITIDGDAWDVAVAATSAMRARGLMGVTDLGDLDGMLFVFDSDIDASFWMKDTLIPLDIAFFDSAGSLVAVRQMEPCLEDPCPTYGPGSPFRYAIEAPLNALLNLPPGAMLDIGG